MQDRSVWQWRLGAQRFRTTAQLRDVPFDRSIGVYPIMPAQTALKFAYSNCSTDSVATNASTIVWWGPHHEDAFRTKTEM